MRGLQKRKALLAEEAEYEKTQRKGVDHLEIHEQFVGPKKELQAGDW